jgi:hypothetical protein
VKIMLIIYTIEKGINNINGARTRSTLETTLNTYKIRNCHKKIRGNPKGKVETTSRPGKSVKMAKKH